MASAWGSSWGTSWGSAWGDSEEEPAPAPSPVVGGWSTMMRRHRVPAATHYPPQKSIAQIECEANGGEWINGACVYPRPAEQGPAEVIAAVLKSAARAETERQEQITARRRRLARAALLH